MRLVKGFSLIELLIVIAVIGIVSAIAVPSYNNYVVKSQVTASFHALFPLKTTSSLYVQEHGVFPDNSASSAIGVPVLALGNISLLPQSIPGSGSIEFTFTSTDAAHGQLRNKKFLLSRSSTGLWKCITQTTPLFVPLSYLPDGCGTP
ncbi:pilin [Vibrio hepatarius]|uniref:pilin n=1 Tax=Vibrio hepatarius TaxID=171383 RepID=UPI0016B22E0F|nr:pilin [Vibrio hepatarius]